MAAQAPQEDHATEVPAIVPTASAAPAPLSGSDPAEVQPHADLPVAATPAAYGEIPNEPLPEDGLLEFVSPWSGLHTGAVPNMALRRTMKTQLTVVMTPFREFPAAL